MLEFSLLIIDRRNQGVKDQGQYFVAQFCCQDGFDSHLLHQVQVFCI